MEGLNEMNQTILDNAETVQIFDKYLEKLFIS